MVGNKGGDGYLPLELLSCPACGVAQNESGGWCDLTLPPPCRTRNGTLPTQILWEKRPFRDRGMMVKGCNTTGLPYQYQAGSGGVTPMNLPTGPPRIPGFVTNIYATPCMMGPNRSSVARIYPQSSQPPFETVGILYLLFW